jgi:hypothetical protein
MVVCLRIDMAQSQALLTHVADTVALFPFFRDKKPVSRQPRYHGLRCEYDAGDIEKTVTTWVACLILFPEVQVLSRILAITNMYDEIRMCMVLFIVVQPTERYIG